MDALDDGGLSAEEHRLTRRIAAASAPADAIVGAGFWNDPSVLREVCDFAGIDMGNTSICWPRRVPNFKADFVHMPGHLTAPEAVIGKPAGTKWDHRLWCSVAHHRIFGRLVDYPIRPDYWGAPCPIDATGDSREAVGEARRRSVLYRKDVLAAWPRWEEMWRCAREIGLDELVLSKRQVGPLCGLNEDKAAAFVELMKQHELVTGREDATSFGSSMTLWTLVDDGEPATAPEPW